MFPVPLRNLLGPLVLALSGAGASLAEESRQGVFLELNSMSAGKAGCLLSFVAQNGSETSIDRIVFETVLFTTEGRVAQLTLLDFGPLPPSVPRVRQFEFPGTSCQSIGRVLINGTQTCESGGAGGGACSAPLSLTSKTDAELIG